jgi:hypothetical protein
MVAFTRIPYHEVIERAARQDAALNAALGCAALLGAAGLALAALKLARGQGGAAAWRFSS